MMQDENGKWPVPTLDNLSINAGNAAFEVWQWLRQSETGFKDETALGQAVAVELRLQIVLRHPDSLEKSELIREVIIKEVEACKHHSSLIHR